MDNIWLGEKRYRAPHPEEAELVTKEMFPAEILVKEKQRMFIVEESYSFVLPVNKG